MCWNVIVITEKNITLLKTRYIFILTNSSKILMLRFWEEGENFKCVEMSSWSLLILTTKMKNVLRFFWWIHFLKNILSDFKNVLRFFLTNTSKFLTLHLPIIHHVSQCTTKCLENICCWWCLLLIILKDLNVKLKMLSLAPGFFWQRLELFKVITSNFYGENEKT